jgi:nickel-dependent lactate racemase
MIVMKVELKYAKGKIDFEIDPRNYMGTLLPNDTEHLLTGKEEVKRALENPIGSRRLGEIVSKGERVAIITSDITRPMPSSIVLPIVIKELKDAGIEEEDITIVFALGIHRKHSEEEKRMLAGEEIYESAIKIIDSDADDCVNLGVCKNGTPVDIFRPVAEADRLVCLGNIEYHYFAGYSGGAKAIMPGTSSRRAIQINHSNMVKDEARAGNIETNPVRQDIDETGNHIKIDFIVNVVLNSKKEIVCTVAGDFIKAHREGCKVLDAMYGVEIKAKADIAIVSPGGFPKDINLYQSQKGLDNAKHSVRDGGIIILAASAKEGFGEKTFEEWMKSKTPEQMISEIRENFKLGGHKAAAIAMILQKVKIFMVSDLDEDLVRSINFKPFKSVQDALEAALFELGRDSKAIILPLAGSTLPIIMDS